VTLVVIAGLGAGAGLLGVLAGLRGSRPTLNTVLAAIERETAFPGAEGISAGAGFGPPSPWRVDRLLGARLGTMLESRRSFKGRLESALKLTGTPLETLCSQAVLGGIVGLLVPAACWGVVSLVGAHVSPVVPVWAGLVFACTGALFPLVALSTEAKRQRREARRVIGIYLDLVVLCLAGGMGIEGALHSAAQIGDNEVLARLLGALVLARDSGAPPWDALAELGTELGVGELAELAAAAGLAGTHGARIRATLAAKAASIRRHELAEAETEANSITERLFLPGVLLLVGFLFFIGYPAVARIASGF
jgi:tight adherence protein C